MSMDYNQLMQQLQQMRQQGGGQPGSVIPLPGQSGNGMPSLAQLLQASQMPGGIPPSMMNNMLPQSGGIPGAPMPGSLPNNMNQGGGYPNRLTMPEMNKQFPQIPPPTNAGMNPGAYPNQIDKQMQMSPGYMDFMNNAYDNIIKQMKNSPNVFEDPRNPIPPAFRNY